MTFDTELPLPVDVELTPSVSVRAKKYNISMLRAPFNPRVTHLKVLPWKLDAFPFHAMSYRIWHKIVLATLMTCTQSTKRKLVLTFSIFFPQNFF